MSVHAFVQARLGSTRLPGKSVAAIAGKPALVWIVERLAHAPGVDHVAVLTSTAPGDAPLRALCADNAITCVAGSEDDVLQRFADATRALEPDAVVRITADCPLVDPEVVGTLVSLYHASGDLDHCAVATGAMAPAAGLRRYPDGLDAEVVRASTLLRVASAATDPYEREHVTPHIWRRPAEFRLGLLQAPEDWGEERWTVDHAADLEFVRAVYERVADPARFGVRDVLAILDGEPALRAINAAERDAAQSVR
ncbi:MAG: spore coat polysaccharide biosynthesis protein SpsF [bacterium]|jgi:spore coat polysaccharide biosynthesis protein SpsF